MAHSRREFMRIFCPLRIAVLSYIVCHEWVTFVVVELLLGARSYMFEMMFPSNFNQSAFLMASPHKITQRHFPPINMKILICACYRQFCTTFLFHGFPSLLVIRLMPARLVSFMVVLTTNISFMVCLKLIPFVELVDSPLTGKAL